ncbi:MAG: contractile injection system protein, VgrG/Pvc8 family [Sulfitobacter sp.]
MKIDYQILADGADVTAQFRTRLVGISIIDEAGQKSDVATIEVDDRNNEVAIPPIGAKLEIALGYVGDLTTLGQFIVDDVSGTIGTETMSIGAKAADMLGGIRAPKTRSWHDVTLGELVAKIAGENDLKPQVAESLKSTLFNYIAQTSESDLNLLTRLAKNLDAVAKPAGGSLLFLKRGEGKSADGKDLPVFDIDRSDIDTGSWKLPGRTKYEKVTAEWAENGSATVHQVHAGTGKPVQKLRERFATKAEAERAAQSALDKSKRGTATINIRLGGFRGDLMAEAKVNLTNIKPEMTGEWLITQVQHQLGTSLRTSFRAERNHEATQA